MPLDSLYELLMEQLREVYNAENQLLTALPKMAAFASTPALKAALEEHLTETQHQVSRLEQAFAELGVAARGKRCRGMEGLLEDGKEIMEQEGDETILDAALISAARRVEHYEIAAYGSVASYADLLGETRVATLLRTSLEEELAAEQALGRISEQDVNAMAVLAGTEEETEA